MLDAVRRLFHKVPLGHRQLARVHKAMPPSILLCFEVVTTPVRAYPWRASLVETGSPWICANRDRKSTRLNSSHVSTSYAVFCLKKQKRTRKRTYMCITHNTH